MSDVGHKEANNRLIRSLVFFGGFSFVCMACLYLLTLRSGIAIPRDSSSLVIGRDFLNLWMYGRAAHSAEPWRWYDVVAYHHELAAMFGAGYPPQNWSYPPSIMLLAAPFGLIGYLPALGIWTATGLGTFAAALWRRVRARRVLFVALMSPAAVMCLTAGQNAFFISALLIGAFWLVDERPAISGLLIGLLTIKPQLGVLIPVVLIASGRWRVFGWATAASLGIAALTAWLFGLHSWIAFVTQGIPTQDVIMADARGLLAPFSPTVFINLHSAGASFSFAMAVQACVFLAALLTVAWAFRYRRGADPVVLFALFVTCTTAALPYLLVYDTLPLTVAALLLLAGGKLDATGRVMAVLAYWLPLLQAGFGMAHIPGPALIAPAFAVYLVQRLRQIPDASPIEPTMPWVPRQAVG